MVNKQQEKHINKRQDNVKRKKPVNKVEEALAVVESLPKQEREMAVKQITTSFYAEPIPHPSHFQAYEDILPGSADRILSMAEKQQGHRQQLEKATIFSSIEDSKRGNGLDFC